MVLLTNPDTKLATDHGMRQKRSQERQYIFDTVSEIQIQREAIPIRRGERSTNINTRRGNLSLTWWERQIETYLIFVIFLHGQNFWKIKFTTKFTVNCQFTHSKLPIFCVKSVKIYTDQKKFTRTPSVTNMRYEQIMNNEVHIVVCNFDIRSKANFLWVLVILLLFDWIAQGKLFRICAFGQSLSMHDRQFLYIVWVLYCKN